MKYLIKKIVSYVYRNGERLQEQNIDFVQFNNKVNYTIELRNDGAVYFCAGKRWRVGEFIRTKGKFFLSYPLSLYFPEHIWNVVCAQNINQQLYQRPRNTYVNVQRAMSQNRIYHERLRLHKKQAKFVNIMNLPTNSFLNTFFAF